MTRVCSFLSTVHHVVPALAIAAITTLLPLLATSASGQSASNIITFDAPGAGTKYGQGTFAAGMNSQGTIVGYIFDSSNRAAGFIRSADGSISIIQAPGAVDTYFESINDSGTISGEVYFNGNAKFYAFIRSTDGTFTYFRPLHTQFLDGNKIDNLGNVAGTILSTFDFFVCYIRTADGTVTTFTPPSGFECQTGDIAAGTVSGTYGAPSGNNSAFLRHPDGTYTPFLVGYQVGGAVLNSARTAAGSFVFSDDSWHGYIRAANGAISYFTLPGTTSTYAADINSGGIVTGGYGDASSSATHGFQRLADGTVEKFDAPGAGTGQFQGTFPVKINDAGSITGLAADSSNVFHGFLLTP